MVMPIVICPMHEMHVCGLYFGVFPLVRVRYRDDLLRRPFNSTGIVFVKVFFASFCRSITAIQLQIVGFFLMVPFS